MRRREGRWPGVRSPVHARGAPDVDHERQRHQRQPSSRAARTPRMGPAPVPRTTCPGCSGAPLRIARHRGWQQGGGGTPGRRPHSRCPGCCRAWMVMTRLWVVGLGAAPRAWAGERGCRHRPGERSRGGRAFEDSRGHLPSADAWAQSRRSKDSKGPKSTLHDTSAPDASPVARRPAGPLRRNGSRMSRTWPTSTSSQRFTPSKAMSRSTSSRRS
jgi:hypothetical protein